MKKIFISTMVFILLVPCLVFSDLVNFKVGYFIPRAQSDLWDIEFENMDFTKNDYLGSIFGFSYEYFLSNELSILGSVDGYNRKKVGVYQEFVGETVGGYDYAFDYGEGFAISHVFNVSITPIQVSLKLTPAGRRGKFIPYMGGGIGVYIWTLRLQGEMIDFSDPELFYDPFIDADVIGYPIYLTDAREENKFTIGYHAFGGIMFPIANRISIEGEFKYNFVNGGLTEGFLGFESFDLSGIQISLGLNYWF
ncbi:MAG: hypothetical protein ACLFVG_08905 [Candidatus Aminicenantes bacterium]